MLASLPLLGGPRRPQRNRAPRHRFTAPRRSEAARPKINLLKSSRSLRARRRSIAACVRRTLIAMAGPSDPCREVGYGQNKSPYALNIRGPEIWTRVLSRGVRMNMDDSWLIARFQ